jgi:hypothetical protein
MRKPAAAKKRFGRNKYALQNKDTEVKLVDSFEVSSALQKKIHVGCRKEERAADLLAAPRLLAARPSHGLDTAIACDSGFARRRRKRTYLSLADASKRESALLEMANLC